MARSEKHNKDNDSSTGIDASFSMPLPEQFNEWLDYLNRQELLSWERLPDIGLYMDQVLTLMDRQLSMYKREGEGKLLTQPMINNYTKDGLLPRATDKKYAQGHLALLSVLCSLKPVLSMSDVSVLLKNVRTGMDERTLYEYFMMTQKQAIEETTAALIPMVEEMKDTESEEMKGRIAQIALQMAIEARVSILMAQQIIDTLQK